ncbi:peptidase M28 family protein [Mangrovimicrobium sediminis]|uniref:Carboxypeptidase Q n=1 Tax=Mangrovimicrobium sediminis TaxID=2562682 RepID=A0A4Z0M785_9GAMM|nr:M20/M25/M40 family metallo-hydrolase [Haliea sp. SAOS-164]TGD75175.1 peptidase M28 family protein [Haliea sp. SAOS-164]
MSRFLSTLYRSHSLAPPWALALLLALAPLSLARAGEGAAEAQAFAQRVAQESLAYELVTSLTTEVGPRLAGTPEEARARRWAVDKLKALGFSNVRQEPFELPVWRRGLEIAEITAPFPQPLAVTTLGGSVSTGPEGVEGEVLSVATVAALQGLPADAVAGRIVFVDEVMTRTQDGSGYGVAAAKRRTAAYAAHEKGALAVLIRSVGTHSHRLPHTGQMRRVTEPGDNPGVPAAALSAPDADQLARVLARAGSARVRLVLTPQQRPAGKSANVVAEIPGRLAPQEIVLVGAHLDSWDLGTGAVDDGAGVAIVTAAAKHLMDAMPRGPARTVRIVLFGAEEVGLVGAKAYAEAHREELANHVIAAESDFGAGRIWRFDTGVGEGARDAALALAQPMAVFGVVPGNDRARGGPDLKYLRESGVPVVTLLQNGLDYFDLHHTADDTLDKIDPDDLAQNVAVYAAFLYQVANGGELYR